MLAYNKAMHFDIKDYTGYCDHSAALYTNATPPFLRVIAAKVSECLS